jgi:hypothetical protein
MREYYTTRINGLIKHGKHVLACPKCGIRAGLTVCGFLGDPAVIQCLCGEEFSPPKPFDAVYLLKQVSTSTRRETTSLTYGQLPY